MTSRRARSSTGRLLAHLCEHYASEPLYVAALAGDVQRLRQEAKGPEELALPLVIAAFSGNLRGVETLLAAGASPSLPCPLIPDVDPLCAALQEMCLPVVEMLLKANVPVDRLDLADYETPLYVAIGKDNIDAVRFFIKAGANVNFTSEMHFSFASPVFYAIHLRRAEILRELVSAGANINAVHKQATALLHAIKIDWFDGMQILVQAGANVNETSFRVTPLGATLMTQSPEDITHLQFLLAHGADANLHSEYGLTPLMVAAWEGRDDAVKILVAAGADINAMFMPHPSDVPGMLEGPLSALHLAFVLPDPTPIITLLLSLGLDLKRDAYRSIAWIAVEAGRLEALRVLLQAGAMVSGLETPLAISAIASSNYEVRVNVLKEIIAYGANVAECDACTGRSAIHMAAEMQDADAVAFLLSMGMDPNAGDRDGNTPLIALAATATHNSTDAVAVALALIEGGADVNCCNHALVSPLHAAAEARHLPLVEMMLKEGAVQGADKNGLMPSAYGGQEAQVVAMLTEAERLHRLA